MIFFIIFIISISVIIDSHLEYKKSEESIDELVEDAIIDDNTIDWDYLKSVNSDIIAWIYIEGTNINYPILNSKYYLYHTFQKQYNRNGSIFSLNKNPFENDETVIYGHNMKDDIMFSELSKYSDLDFLKNHQIIKIYTETKNYEAKIFSFYQKNVYQESENTENLGFSQKIEYYKSSSDFELEVDEDISKIIKLVTCSYVNSTESPTKQRYYVIAAIFEND